MSIIDFYKSQLPYPLKKHFICKEDQYVYLIFNPINRLYKIGITNSLRNRYKSLVSQSGIQLILIDAIELADGFDENSKLVETIIHKFFDKKRVTGEWFYLSKFDLARLHQLMRYLEGSDTYRKEFVYLKDYKNIYA